MFLTILRVNINHVAKDIYVWLMNFSSTTKSKKLQHYMSVRSMAGVPAQCPRTDTVSNPH